MPVSVRRPPPKRRPPARTPAVNSTREPGNSSTCEPASGKCGCALHDPRGCGCMCGNCTFLHYVPIPKTASEATKGGLGTAKGVTGTLSKETFCTGQSVCYLGPNTHEANKRLPPMPAALAPPLSAEWWAQTHTTGCEQYNFNWLPGTRSPYHSNFVRIATVRGGPAELEPKREPPAAQLSSLPPDGCCAPCVICAAHRSATRTSDSSRPSSSTERIGRTCSGRSACTSTRRLPPC